METKTQINLARVVTHLHQLLCSAARATLRMRNVATCSCESNSCKRQRQQQQREEAQKEEEATQVCALRATSMAGLASGNDKLCTHRRHARGEGREVKTLMGWETLLACSRVDKLFARLATCLPACLATQLTLTTLTTLTIRRPPLPTLAVISTWAKTFLAYLMKATAPAMVHFNVLDTLL